MFTKGEDLMKKTILAGPLMALGLFAATPAALAQHGGERGPPPAAIAGMQAREADDIALLLGLRAPQRPALAAFLQSMAPPPRPEHDRSTEPGEETAPPADGFAQHLDRMTQDTARRSAEDTQRIAAARTFYAALDAGQRRSFEALMRLRHGPGRGPGPHGPMHDGDGPPPPMGSMSPPMGGMPPRP